MTDVKNVIKIENVYSWLITENMQLRETLCKALKVPAKNYWHSSAYKKKLWDGMIEFFKKNSGMFYTGLLPEVCAALKHLNEPYEIADHRGSIPWLYKSIDEKFLQQFQKPDEKPMILYDYQVDYVNQALKYGRGVITAPTGCHRKGQLILMHDGSLKCVEDVKIGDNIMGPDSKPRKVLQLCRGQGQMYEITPVKGESFVVNEDHILTLQKIKSGTRYVSERKEWLVDVSVKDYVNWSKNKKHNHKLLRNGVEFADKEISIDAYFLGVLLSDGSMTSVPCLTTKDPEILKACQDFAKTRQLKINKVSKENRRPTYSLTKPRGKNSLTSDLRELELWGKTSGNKFMPFVYKTNSREIRLNILAGLLDTDGSLSHKGFDYISKSKQLAEDVAFVSRSLGLAAYIKETRKKCQTGNGGLYYRVSISGETNIIPTRIPIKQSGTRIQKKNVLRTGFQIKKLDIEDFFGFVLNEDRRYLMGDFTITHNSGKTNVLIALLKCLPEKTPVLFMTKGAGLVDQNYKEMLKWNISNLGRYYGKYKEPNYIMCCTIHQDTLKSIEKLLPKFRVLFVDEVHDAMSDTPIWAYKKLKECTYRFGFSATPYKYTSKDNQGKEVTKDKEHKYKVKAHFGATFLTSTTENGKLTTKDLQARGILSPSRCTIYPMNEPDNIQHEPYGDAVTLGIANNVYFHNTVKRLARSLKGRTLIMVERIDQGNYLKALMPEAHWVKGDMGTEERAEIFGELKFSDDNVICIAMRQIVTAGINVFLMNLINACGGNAEHNIIQQMGRGLRCSPDKDKLDYFDFLYTTNNYLRDHSLNRIKTLESEGHEIIVKEKIDF